MAFTSTCWSRRKTGVSAIWDFLLMGIIKVIQRFLDAYGKDMEFCQLQLNYLDWEFQNAKQKVELLDQWNIPVWVMEPLRGGKLASLAPEYEEKLKELRPEEGIPAWAFRYLQSLPSVKVILSGMSNRQQMEENIQTFAEDKPLNAKELETIHSIADSMVKKIVLPCTACHYCTSHCPQGLDIPGLLALYNEHCFTQGGLLPRWPCLRFLRRSSPAPVLAAAAVRLYVPRELRSPRLWPTLRPSWAADGRHLHGIPQASPWGRAD